MANFLNPVNQESLRIKFDGPALAGHSMDVCLLGPSLTGLGKLLKAANKVVNGNDAAVRVDIKADIKANCVTLDLDVIQGFLDSLKHLFGSGHIKDAKELLEWLGLIIETPGKIVLGIGGVWRFYLWLSRRKPGEKIVTRENGDQISVRIDGSDNHITVNKNVYILATDPDVQQAMKMVVSPLKADGIETLTVGHDSGSVKVTKEEARQVMEATPADLDPRSDPQILVGHILIHAPEFDPNSKIWKFKWNERVERIDISNTDIARKVLDRGGVRVGDAFKVQMEVIERRTKKGYKQYFKVIEVLNFVPCATQTEMDMSDDDLEDSETEDWV